MIFKNLVVSGNSFTQDGIGGCPPTENSVGGCSFIDQGQGAVSQPASWASIVAQLLNVQSFVNLAASSHSNTLVANTLRYVLQNFNYSPENTLVLFNCSIATRLDIPCEFDHPDASNFIPWDKTLFPHSYLDRDCKIYKTFEKNIGIDTIKSIGYTQIDFLFNWLEANKYQYYFLLTDTEDLKDPEFLKIVESRRDRLIEINPGIGMWEYGQISGNNTVNNYHPDAVGRQDIALQVVKYVAKNMHTVRFCHK